MLRPMKWSREPRVAQDPLVFGPNKANKTPAQYSRGI